MEFQVFDLGLISFKEAWDFQKGKLNAVKSGFLKSALILCRHKPVITLGRLARKKNILASPEILKQKGIELYEIDRGGDVTYHGPGQVTIYPVFNLHYFKKDIHLFLRKLEEVVIDFLSDFGIEGLRYAGRTGVWIGKEKISSIGISLKNWITLHGVTINIKKDDLDNFQLIRPCDMDIQMTSLETVLGRDINIDGLKESIVTKFKVNFLEECICPQK